jgi:hypothetical protein
MTLAITTTTGQWHEARGRVLLHDFATFTHSTAQVTPPTKTATLDAVYTRDGILVAVAEAKTRISYDHATIAGYGSYLVTEDKLDCLLATGKALGVPSFLLTELSDGVLLYWPVGDANGHRMTGWTAAHSRTLATSVDTTTVVRRNAYLPMSCAVRWGRGVDIRQVAP